MLQRQLDSALQLFFLPNSMKCGESRGLGYKAIGRRVEVIVERKRKDVKEIVVEEEEEEGEEEKDQVA